MAKKKDKVKNKGIKVLKERVNTPFKELEEEEIKFDTDEDLEEKGIENKSPQTPITHTTSNAPVLEESNQSQTPNENLEEELEDVPATGEGGNIYNAPDYGENYEMGERREGDEETGEVIGIRETSEEPIERRIDNRAFQRQMREPEMREERDYEVMDLREEEKEEGLPFESKKRKRG